MGFLWVGYAAENGMLNCDVKEGPGHEPPLTALVVLAGAG